MDNSRDYPQSLTLSRLCSLLDVPFRKVQYLREVGVLEPTVSSSGRGKACKYSFLDAVLVWVAVVELDGIDYEKKRCILDQLRSDLHAENNSAKIGNFSSVHIDLKGVQAEVRRRIKLTSSLKSSI